MFCITAFAEEGRTAEDKIKTGEMIKKRIGGVEDNMAGCFLLYRGVQMKEEWLQPWIEKVGQKVRIPGNTSSSQNLKVALGFAAG